MRRAIVKSGLISVGVGFLLSAPISHFAMESWDNSPQVTFEDLPEDFSGIQAEEIQAKAHEIFKAAERRQEILDAELARQERIELEREAQYTLAEYEVMLPEDIQTYCERAQAETNVCAELLEAVCWKESRFDAKASNGGCEGIAQISTRWHKGRMKKLGVTDIYDAEGNIRVSADYLAELFAKWDGDTYAVLKEYNGDTSDGVSDYAIEICEVSAALERVHGK